MSPTLEEAFRSAADKIHRQLERGIITRVEAGIALIRVCHDVASDTHSYVGASIGPELGALLLELDWAPLNAVVWVSGSLQSAATPASVGELPLRRAVEGHFRRVLCAAADDAIGQLKEIGEQTLVYGVDQLPDAIVDEYLTRHIDSLRLWRSEGSLSDVDDGDLVYLDPTARRVRLHKALLRQGDFAAARDVAMNAWKATGEPGELIELATVTARGANPSAAAAVFDGLPVDGFIAARLWSPIACLASLSCEMGDDERALEYSGMINDDLVDSGQADDPTVRRPEDPWGIWSLECNDVQIFGALSFIDLICGSRERAGARANRFGVGRDTTGWESAGQRVMAAWVLQSLSTRASEQLAILDVIADTRHAKLGALEARVALTAAEIHFRLGDRTAASKALETARQQLGLATVRLHFSDFAGYGALLRRVAVGQAELDRLAARLAQP